MNKYVKSITAIDEDFAKWYTDVVLKAELVDYSGIRGCTILRPYGYAIWENIMSFIDKNFKSIGIENVSMPLFIPESLLQKEKNHIQGFAPEVAWVTIGGQEELTERLCVRPTSEVLFCSHFSKIVNSWRDLPKLYNQWCSVVRWEKSSRPFLRSVEIHWQEGHTVHEHPDEAKKFSLKILDLYANFFKEILCIPVILGQKTELEKFAGAKTTYTVECIMKDGKALQSATSHYFGNDFTKAFDVKFQKKDNNFEFAYYTSWGLTTRVIGAVIMTHGDSDGLVLPPDIAPYQIVVIPIGESEEVLNKSLEIFNILSKNFRVKIDKSDKSSGWKFSEYEMKGVPIRLEIGPKDILNNSCILVRRDNRQKYVCEFDLLDKKIYEIINDIKFNMYESAKKRCKEKMFIANTIDEFNDLSKKDCFIKTFWCGRSECEESIKNKFGFSSRCIPFKEKHETDIENTSIKNKDTCIVCNKNAISQVYWGKAY